MGLFTLQASFARSNSYIILQESGPGLLRVSEDGASVTVIASQVTGLDLTIDVNGNYVVTTGSELIRVSPSGEVASIAKAPPGSSWVAVSASRDGSLIVADEPSHLLWRITENNEIHRLASYPGSLPLGENHIGLLVDSSDGCLVMRVSDGNSPELFRIQLDGQISQVTLSGHVRKPTRMSSTPMDTNISISGGPLIKDGSGGYLFLDSPWTKNVFRISSVGHVERFAKLPEPAYHGKVLALNADTKELIVGGLSRLLRIKADGTSDVLSSDTRLNHMTAIVLDKGGDQ